MPRNYQPKGGNAGRPPLDDAPLARSVLFAERVELQKSQEIRRDAADLLIASRQNAGTSIDYYSARRRVKDAVAAEVARQGDTPFTGWPSSFRALGTLIADAVRRDGAQAGRAMLVNVLTLYFADLETDDPQLLARVQQDGEALQDLRRRCVALAEAWLDEATGGR